MLLVQDKQPVETLRTNRAHEALRHAVRLRSPERRTNNLAPNPAKYFVETVRELLVPVANQIAEAFWVAQAPCQLAGLLGHPLRARRRRAAREMHAPAAQFDEEEDIQPLEPDRVHREEVDGERALAMRSQKLTPCHPATPAGGSKTGLQKPRPHRGGRHHHTEACQFATIRW